jgi:transcriptional regulator with XRE-family HTH domain
MPHLAQRLRKIREECGLSIYALWKLSGVGVATISEIESGKNTSPGLVTMVKLADVLNVSLDTLAGRPFTGTGKGQRLS